MSTLHSATNPRLFASAERTEAQMKACPASPDILNTIRTCVRDTIRRSTPARDAVLRILAECTFAIVSEEQDMRVFDRHLIRELGRISSRSRLEDTMDAIRAVEAGIKEALRDCLHPNLYLQVANSSGMQTKYPADDDSSDDDSVDLPDMLANTQPAIRSPAIRPPAGESAAVIDEETRTAMTAIAADKISYAKVRRRAEALRKIRAPLDASLKAAKARLRFTQDMRLKADIAKTSAEETGAPFEIQEAAVTKALAEATAGVRASERAIEVHIAAEEVATASEHAAIGRANEAAASRGRGANRDSASKCALNAAKVAADTTKVAADNAKAAKDTTEAAAETAKLALDSEIRLTSLAKDAALALDEARAASRAARAASRAARAALDEARAASFRATTAARHASNRRQNTAAAALAASVVYEEKSQLCADITAADTKATAAAAKAEEDKRAAEAYQDKLALVVRTEDAKDATLLEKGVIEGTIEEVIEGISPECAEAATEIIHMALESCWSRVEDSCQSLRSELGGDKSVQLTLAAALEHTLSQPQSGVVIRAILRGLKSLCSQFGLDLAIVSYRNCITREAAADMSPLLPVKRMDSECYLCETRVNVLQQCPCDQTSNPGVCLDCALSLKEKDTLHPSCAACDAPLSTFLYPVSPAVAALAHEYTAGALRCPLNGESKMNRGNKGKADREAAALYAAEGKENRRLAGLHGLLHTKAMGVVFNDRSADGVPTDDLDAQYSKLITDRTCALSLQDK